MGIYEARHGVCTAAVVALLGLEVRPRGYGDHTAVFDVDFRGIYFARKHVYQLQVRQFQIAGIHAEAGLHRIFDLFKCAHACLLYFLFQKPL
ncbi:hypothetical protein SDC9_181488 [bioreactor metagenome]|uniref:Uncharacterized protein n=1 Tax=bioreactor metagenome TaxID=1076179 RepID=A0A645H677_9ZZZZ